MNCPVCGFNTLDPLLEQNGYPIVRCAQCGFLFVSPPPSADQLRAFYQQAEYYAGSELGYSDYLGERRRHEQLALARLRLIERRRSTRGRVLDLGCAAGFFLNVAQQRGWEPLGVELSREMAAHAERLIGRPVAPTLDTLAIAPDSLAAATMWEYIEHVPHPRAEVEQLVGLLQPGGVLALSTPNAGYWTAVHDPQRWRELKPPAHLGFFSEATLRRLLAECGLQDIMVRRIVARAPQQPYALRQLLMLLRRLAGSAAERHTPFWWTYSLAWRLVELASQVSYRLRWPGSDLAIGLEAYASKPSSGGHDR
jgi:2-polyprenyl-3-methyl-5-hydroxy-6-metoxy-1,4-benzoquinol methylase